MAESEILHVTYGVGALAAQQSAIANLNVKVSITTELIWGVVSLYREYKWVLKLPREQFGVKFPNICSFTLLVYHK